MAVPGTSASGAWATVNMVAPTAAVFTAPPTAEHESTGAITTSGDPQPRANLQAHGLVREAKGDFRGGAQESNPCTPAIVLVQARRLLRGGAPKPGSMVAVTQRASQGSLQL